MTTQQGMPEQIDLETRRVPRFGGFSWGFFRVELKRVFSNSGTVVFSLVFPIAMLIFVALPNRHTAATAVPVAAGGPSAAVPIMMSMALYGAMMASTMIGVTVANERGQGWSRQLRLTPLNPVVYILIKIACGMAMGFVGVGATVTVGLIIGLRADPINLIISGLIAWLSSLMLTALGLTIGYAFPAQNAMRYLGPVLPILSFMGGLFIPLSILPGIAQTAAKFTPLWGITDLVQSTSIGQGIDGWAVVSLVFWFALFLFTTVWMFRRDTSRV